MKRNWDLIRKILISLENCSEAQTLLQDTDIKGYDSQTVAYHYKLLHTARLIEAQDWSSMNEMSYAATSLTWQGHEFLDKIRNDSVWNKIKTTVQSKSLDLSFDVIKQVATATISAMLP